MPVIGLGFTAAAAAICVGLAAVVLPVELPLLVCAVGAAVWALTRPWGLAVVVAPAFVFPSMPGLGPISAPLTMGCVSLGAALIFWHYRGRPQVSSHMLSALAVLTLGSLAFGVANGGHIQDTVAFPLVWLAGVIAGCSAAREPNSMYAAGAIVGLLGAIAILEAAGVNIVLPGAVGSSSYSDFANTAGAERAVATFSHPLIAGAVFTCFAALLARQESPWRYPVVALLVLAALTTVSRSAMLGLTACAVVLLVQEAKRPIRMSIQVAAGVLIIWAGLSALPQVRTSIENRVLHTEERQLVREGGFAQFRGDVTSRPATLILGGSIGSAEALLRSQGGIAGYFIFDDQYITLVYDFGLLILVVALGLVVVAAVKADRRARRAALPAFAALAVTMFFVDGLYWASLGLTTGIVFGVLTAPIPKSDIESGTTTREGV